MTSFEDELENEAIEKGCAVNVIPTVIWKAELKAAHMRQQIELPENSMVMSAAEQHGKLVIWFRCDPKSPKTTKEFEVCLSGQEIANPTVHEGQRFIDTVLFDGGAFVVHVFEVVKFNIADPLNYVDMAGNA